ncbi:hypothetical protein ACP70R_033498 [Stipagrostis hirtigluma subsp. patula]
MADSVPWTWESPCRLRLDELNRVLLSKHFKWSTFVLPADRGSSIRWHFCAVLDKMGGGGGAVFLAAAMAPELPAAATTTYPAKRITEAIAFLQKVKARFASAPGVRDEFVALLAGLGNGGGDADAVVSRAKAILAGHPDLLADFDAFRRGGADVPAAAGGTSLAASRPRRSVRKKKDGGDGSRESAGDRGAGGAAAREDDDVRLPEAEAFVRQVRKRAGDAACARFIAVVRAAGEDRSMDANAIYDGAKEALGAAHGDLLTVFAAVYLPGLAEWEEQEARRLAPKRKHAASSFAGAVDDDTRSRAAKNRKPLTGDGNRRFALHDGECSGGGTSTHRHHHGLDLSWRPQTAGKNTKVQFSRQLEDGCNFADDHKVFRIKAKNGRANGGHRRFVTISVGNEATGSKAEARGKDGGDGGRRRGEKKLCRRATNGEGSGKAVAAPAQSEGHGEVLRFRRMWEFETGYSKLVATMARAEELLHGGGGGAHAHGARASMEELFPSRECREFLELVYGEEEWRHMRRALERGGECAGVALETVLRRLGETEAAAVEDAREQEDPVRAAKRLNTVATDTVEEERRRRRNAGDGGA